ncbi:hypothetical protein FIBSPDRAFT_736764 [Athelia psychrophila]|uniref:Endonuclease/exonuclease/phosphatase domain-containing protein n=1 Tax=Athelia psychrophila TaxID=1759441 RepID=A0A166MB96_9AGAM|nr:hypothetical protein FIBSPDRAFT_736764 [Fibularhizoctonia sp. CBS 109695]
MADGRFEEIDAARYSARHRVWRKTSKSAKILPGSPLPNTIKIVTWNIDFSTPNVKSRLKTALAYIQRDVLQCKSGERPHPCVILLQEIHRDSFRLIFDDEWVQKYFVVAPKKMEEWPDGAYYGNVTLVSRTVPVCGVHSIVYESYMNRNALMVDLKLSLPAWHAVADESSVVRLRVANTHLESLPSPGAQLRPRQLELVADALADPHLIGGLVCGDMNAISPPDAGLPERVGLVDAYDAYDALDDEGGLIRDEEEDEASHTWGYQPECEFPPGRLDKILYSPGAGGFSVDRPKRIGIGIRTDKGQWASDHYGLLTTVRILA